MEEACGLKMSEIADVYLFGSAVRKWIRLTISKFVLLWTALDPDIVCGLSHDSELSPECGSGQRSTS